MRPDRSPGLADPDEDKRNQATKQSYEQAIQKMEAHISKQADGTLAIDVTAAQIGVDARVFDHLLQSMEQANGMVRGGKMSGAALNILPNGGGGGDGGTGARSRQARNRIAGALSLIGAIPGGVIGGFLALDQAYIQFVDGLGGNQGVVFSQPWFGPGWIRHQ